MSRIDLRVGSVLTDDLDLSGTAKYALDFAKKYALTSGVEATEADLLWYGTRQILATDDDTLDLSGPLTNGLNQAVPFARVKFMMINALAANAGLLEVGGGPTPFDSWLGSDTDFVKVGPGGMLWLVAPDEDAYPVVPATGHLLRVNNPSASPATYDIALIGASA